MIRQAEKYINDVLSGKIEVSQTTRLTFERHKADLRVAPENGWYFDKKAAEMKFDFCGLVNHCPDKRRWVPFEPASWQAAVMYILFGWKKKDGNRRFNYAYIEIPKKNGKTTWAAELGTSLAMFDNEYEAEVYFAASVEKQAHICFDKAKEMIERSPALKKRARTLSNNVSIPLTSSKMEPLGRDSDSMEGINPSGAVIDEYHVFDWKNNQVFQNIQSASINRAQPLIIIITTAGTDKDGPCFDYRNLCLDILKGIKKQDDTFAIIYTPDEDDDWKDPKVWKKVNPNWGVSVRPERFEDEFKGAINSSIKEVAFKTKNLNIWVDAPTVWMKDDKWMLCIHGLKYNDLAGQECYAGLDLSSHIDLIAMALFFPNIKGRPAMRWWHWIPEEKAKEKSDKVDYLLWAKQGHMKMFKNSSIIDVDEMVSDVLDIVKGYNVIGFAYDPHMAHHGVMQGIMKGGFPIQRLDPYSQAHINMSAPTKEFEKMVMSEEFEHFNNPLLRWQMRNVVLYVDKNANISPHRARSREKIDGVMAGITAIGEYLTITHGEPEHKEIYKEHSLRFL